MQQHHKGKTAPSGVVVANPKAELSPIIFNPPKNKLLHGPLPTPTKAFNTRPLRRRHIASQSSLRSSTPARSSSIHAIGLDEERATRPSLPSPCHPLRHADDTLRHSACGTGTSAEARRSRLKSGGGDLVLLRERPIVHHTCQPPHPKPAGKAAPRRGRWVATSSLPLSLPAQPGMRVAHRWSPAKARAPPPPSSLRYPSRSSWDGADLDGPTAASTTTSRRRRRHHRLVPPPAASPLSNRRRRCCRAAITGASESATGRPDPGTAVPDPRPPPPPPKARRRPCRRQPPLPMAYSTLPTVRLRPSRRPLTPCRGCHDIRRRAFA
uniref:Uncharacterized protein n=1 Tax=Oryza nivara TaxID=4536 RepID=A0A0E0G9B0_ORYNI